MIEIGTFQIIPDFRKRVCAEEGLASSWGGLEDITAIPKINAPSFSSLDFLLVGLDSNHVKVHDSGDESGDSASPQAPY